MITGSISVKVAKLLGLSTGVLVILTRSFLEVKMQDPQNTELEAAVYRRLVQHLRDHTEVQNIDLMNLAGFCRNCLSKWYKAAAEERGMTMDYEEAREIVYGMPYSDWKAKYNKEASREQLDAFATRQAGES